MMKGLITGVMFVGVVLVVVIVFTGNSQSAIQDDLCRNVSDLQSSMTSLTGLDASTASKDDFASGVEDVRNSWTNVKDSARSLTKANLQSLDAAWDSFAQTVGSLGNNASVSDAEQAISQSAQGIQGAAQSAKQSYKCS